MEPRRYLRCLGQPALFAPTGEPIRFRTRKHLALLVYLAVEPRRPHQRERLAELLWPTGSRAEARHSLATALSILRPRVGPGALETDRERVTLLPGTVALDLDRLVTGDILGTEVTGPLEVAAFLDGFDIPESGEFAMWKDRQQARLLPATKEALIVLIDRCRRTGDSRQIEQLADRMLALDELSEEAIRAKMEARAFAGDRLTALKIFEEWKQKVGEELGAAPSELVEGMAVRLRRRGWERTDFSHIPTVPTDQWRGRPFIGRGAEYRVLYEAWEGMRKGVPGHAMILGDSGIGKTTLVSRLITAAGLEGAAISRVQCYDLEREIPYATVGNLIHGLLDRPGVSGTPPEALAELARTVVEVRRRFPSIPPPEESQGETARIRLTEAFHQMLLAIAEEHPVILVVDDLHLADDASLAVLHLVMRRSRGQPIMVVAIARPGELARSTRAGRLRETAGLRLQEIEMVPMTEVESRELLRSLTPPDQPQPNSSVRRTLVWAAAGFPMVLELLVQDWQTHGDDSLTLAVGAMTAELRARRGPSTAYQHLISRIIIGLDTQCHNVLNLAAVLGHRLNDLEMYSLLGITPGQCVAGLSQLADLRIMRDGSQGLEFVNELIRAHAYANIPSTIRRSLHGSIVDRLLDVSDDAEPSSGLEVAWHCMRAGRLDQAIPHLLRGAAEAMGRGASHEAERALASALPNLQGELRLDGILLLVEVLQEQGLWQESLDRLEDLSRSDRGERHDDLVVHSALARLNLSASAAEATYDRVSDLIEIVQNCPRLRTRVRAGKVVAYLLERHRNEALSNDLLTSVDSIPTAELDPNALGELGLARALLLYQSGRTAESLEQAAVTVEAMHRRKSANLVTVQLHGGLGALRSRVGQYDGAIDHLEQAFTLAQRLGNDTIITHIVANLVLCLARLGRYSEQAAWLAKISPPSGEELMGFAEVQTTYSVALGHAMQFRHAQALSSMAHLDTRLVGRIPLWIRQAWCLWKADILFICSKKAEALRSAGAGIGQPPALCSPSFAGPFARWLCLLGEHAGGASAKPHLDGLSARLEHFDAIDQVEILCAIVRTEQRSRCNSTETRDQLWKRLGLLPTAVRLQLKALEILPES